jgi:hypothetical protein
LPVAGGVYSFEDAAADCGLADLWPGDLGQRETAQVLLHGALARGGEALVDAVSVITRFGCRRLHRGGRPTDAGGAVLGVFVSVAGFTDGAIGCAKESRPGMLLLDAAHVRRILDGTEQLDDMLRRLHRRLVEKKDPYESAG